MKKTVKIFNEKDYLVGELDFIDYLQFKIDLLKGNHKGKFYIENKDGGKDLIDKYGCVENGEPFEQVSKMFCKIIDLQMRLRIANEQKNK